MATMRSFFYFLKEALRNSRKNFGTTFGAIITIFLSLLVIGVFMVGSIVIDRIVQGVESEVNIQIFLHDDAADADVAMLKSFIEAIPDVKSVRKITKEEALEKFLEMSDPAMIEALDGENPLPASLSIELKNPENVQQVVDEILVQGILISVIETPDNPAKSFRYGQQVIDQLFSIANAIRVVCLVLVIMLIFVALIFINNTIRLAIMARRKEIAIMRLVGASNGFIRGPFAMEGVIQAIVGAGLAILVTWKLSEQLLPQVNNLMPFLKIDYANLNLWVVYLILIAVGFVIGLFGSIWAMRRYLKA
ncbi:MAG: permease-like cell division protein FtsX [Coriobacteriia bacterium]|nr:permease-like cell division protein FtsX [Coriobacteriia bacterium]